MKTRQAKGRRKQLSAERGVLVVGQSGEIGRSHWGSVARKKVKAATMQG